jgi:hypothetical protein
MYSVVVLLMSASVQAQYRKIKSITLTSDVTSATVDRPGDLYLITDGANLVCYDTEGSLRTSGTLPIKPTIFEPRDGSRLFVWSADENAYLFFPPFLNFGDLQTPDSAFAIDPYMVCAAGDHDLIILDSADWSLKRINLKVNRVMYESALGGNAAALKNISHMREYQNFLFILDRDRGIMIFNMLGNLLRTVEGKGIRYFNFLGEELYYADKDKLVFIDLFTTEERSSRIPYAADFALLTDERLYLVRNRKLEIFSIKP